MDSPPTKTEKRRSLAIIAVLVAVVFSGALDYVTDALFFPWTFARPPLLDDWTGRLVAGNGDRLTITLALHRRPPDSSGESCIRCSQIEGTAATCDAQGRIRRYRISGSPRDRQGRQLHLGAMPDVDPPPDGLELDTLKGEWDHADTLTLAADFHWRRGRSATSATDDPATQPVPVRLSRGRAAGIDAPCRGLSAAATP
jgi:hypothetical protein